MSIEAMKLALEALEKLWNIIDDIDTYGDMAKADEKLYRSLVERRQRNRFEETGISTDGYTLNGGAITALREAIEQAEQAQPVAKYSDIVSDGGFDPRNKFDAQRIRKPLTDEEIFKMAEANLRAFSQYIDGGEAHYEGEIDFARAIEAAHGIKGEA